MYFYLYVDDTLFFGTKKEVDMVIEDIHQAFTITTQECLEDYLGCKVTIVIKYKTAYITQPYLVKKIITENDNDELTNQNYKTPGTSGYSTSLKFIQDRVSCQKRKYNAIVLVLVKYNTIFSKVLLTPYCKSYKENLVSSLLT